MSLVFPCDEDLHELAIKLFVESELSANKQCKVLLRADVQAALKCATYNSSIDPIISIGDAIDSINPSKIKIRKKNFRKSI